MIMAISISFFHELFLSLAHFPIGLLIFIFRTSLHIRNGNTFPIIYIANIFSQCVTCLLILLLVFCWGFFFLLCKRCLFFFLTKANALTFLSCFQSLVRIKFTHFKFKEKSHLCCRIVFVCLFVCLFCILISSSSELILMYGVTNEPNVSFF